MQPAPQPVALGHREAVVQRHIRHPVEGRVLGGDGEGDGVVLRFPIDPGGLLQVVADAGALPEQVHPAAVEGVGHRGVPAVQFPVEPPVDIAAPPLIDRHLGAGGDHQIKLPLLEGGQVGKALPVPQGVDDVIGAGGLQLAVHRLQRAGVGAEQPGFPHKGLLGRELFGLVAQPAPQGRHIGQTFVAAQSALDLARRPHGQQGAAKQGARRGQGPAQPPPQRRQRRRQAGAQPHQAPHRQGGDQHRQQHLGAADGPAALGAGQQAVQQVPQLHPQAERKAAGGQRRAAGAAAQQNARRKGRGQCQTDPARRLGDIFAEIAEFVGIAGAEIPGLEGADPPGLLQPGDGVEPADEQHRHPQRPAADQDVLPHPQQHPLPVGAVAAQQEQPVAQRHRQIHGGAHIIAPGHQGAGRRRHHRSRQPPGQGRAQRPAFQQAEQRQADQHRQRQRGRPDHAGAVAAVGGKGEHIPQPGQLQPALDLQKADAAQCQRQRTGAAGAAHDHHADRQHQHLEVEPGAEAGGKHAAAEAVAQHQQQRADAVQFPGPQVDGEVPVGDLAGQQVPHRVVVLEIPVGDLVLDVIAGCQPAHGRQAGQQDQQHQPGGRFAQPWTPLFHKTNSFGWEGSGQR